MESNSTNDPRIRARDAAMRMLNRLTAGVAVMGSSAVGWLDTQGLAARLVDREGTIHRVSGWPSPS